jgi:hypothetical protein
MDKSFHVKFILADMIEPLVYEVTEEESLRIAKAILEYPGTEVSPFLEFEDVSGRIINLNLSYTLLCQNTMGFRNPSNYFTARRC